MSWWHAYGHVREDLGGCYQLVVIGPAEQGPDVAREVEEGAWGDYLTSWDHEPSEREKDALTPEEYQDEPFAVAVDDPDGEA